MVDTIYLTLKGSIVTRDQLMLIDLLAHFDWKRPIYFTQAISPGELGLRDYLQVDGFVYRLVPIATKGDYLNIGRVDADYLYDKLMNEFSYGNIDDPKVYADYTVHNNFYSTQARTLYARLAKALLEKGDTTRAIEVLDTGIRKIPFSQIRHNYMSTVPIIEAYYMAGAFDKGNEVLEEYAKNLEENITYYLRFTGKYKDLTLRDVKENAEYLYDLYQIAGMVRDRPGKPGRSNSTSSTKESWKIKSRKRQPLRHRHGQRDATPINLPTAEGDAENLLTARTGRSRLRRSRAGGRWQDRWPPPRLSCRLEWNHPR